MRTYVFSSLVLLRPWFDFSSLSYVAFTVQNLKSPRNRLLTWSQESLSQRKGKKQADSYDTSQETRRVGRSVSCSFCFVLFVWCEESLQCLYQICLRSFFLFFVFLSISFLLLCFNWRTLHTSLLISSFYLQVQEEMTQVGVVNFGPFLLFCCYTKITKKEQIKLHHKKTGPGLFHTRI